MDIIINIVELASNLADKQVREGVYNLNKSFSEEDIENYISEEDPETGDIRYKKEFQDLYIAYYEEYWSIIEECQTIQE